MRAANAMRDQTMDEILASIHRMIADGKDTIPPGEAAITPEPVGTPEDGAAMPVTAEGWIEAQVAAALGESMQGMLGPAIAQAPESEPLEQRVGRRFVDGLAAGAEDVALIETDDKVETSMSEQQRATVSAVRPDAAPRGQAEPAARPAASDEERLLSDQANGAVGASFDTLSRTILSQNPRTLEDLVRDLLRPMLRTWMDQNLPRMVERMVKQEIDRISRGER